MIGSPATSIDCTDTLTDDWQQVFPVLAAQIWSVFFSAATFTIFVMMMKKIMTSIKSAEVQNIFPQHTWCSVLMSRSRTHRNCRRLHIATFLAACFAPTALRAICP